MKILCFLVILIKWWFRRELGWRILPLIVYESFLDPTQLLGSSRQ